MSKPKPHGFVPGLDIPELHATVTYVELHPVRPSLDRVGLIRHCCDSQEEYSATTVKQYVNGKKGKKYPELCRVCSIKQGQKVAKEKRAPRPSFMHGPTWPMPAGGPESATYYGDTR